MKSTHKHFGPRRSWERNLRPLTHRRIDELYKARSDRQSLEVIVNGVRRRMLIQENIREAHGGIAPNRRSLIENEIASLDGKIKSAEGAFISIPDGFLEPENGWQSSLHDTDFI